MASRPQAIGREDNTATATPIERASRTRTASMVVAIVLAAAFLFYSLRGIDWRRLASILAHADLLYLALATLVTTASLFLRSIRWRILLNAEGAVDVSTAFWATAAGYFGNNFLPARAGEIVRTVMIGSRTGLDNAYVLATALSERAADAIALVAIAAVALFVLPVRPGWTNAAVRPFAILGMIGVVAIAVLPRLEAFGRHLLGHAPLPQSIRPKLISAMEQVLRGLRAFHDARRVMAFLGFTVLIWSADALAAVVAGSALGFAIPVPVAFLLLASLGLSSALPSTPGYVGIYQFVAVSVLTPFGFTRTDAIAFIVVAQALSYLVIGVLGALGFWRYRTSGFRATPSDSSVVVHSGTEGK